MFKSISQLNLKSSQVTISTLTLCLEAESTVRNAVDQVRKQQNNVLNVLEGAQMMTLSKGVKTISPAFQWAQSLDHVFLSVKFATRMDSPGCLDTFDKNITLGNNSFAMYISCRIDK